MRTSTEPEPIVFRSKANTTLHDVFFGESEYGDEEGLFECYVGMPSHGNKPFMTANMRVLDVPQYDHFDDEEYPESSSYFMYGDKKNAFLFHIPTKNPDFLQVIIIVNELNLTLLSDNHSILRGVQFFGGNVYIFNLKQTQDYMSFSKRLLPQSLPRNDILSL